MAVPTIDLNADVGERPGAGGIAADAAILAGVSSASVACGFHAGDAATMRAVCAPRPCCSTSASAHTGRTWTARDRPRAWRSIPRHCASEWFEQIAALRIEAGLEHGVVGYVKPHGALYNRAAVDHGDADAVVAAIASADRHLTLLGPPDSELLRAAAAHGLEGIAESFADRAYRPDRTLAPRSKPGSLLTREQALRPSRQARRRRPLPLTLHP